MSILLPGVRASQIQSRLGFVSCPAARRRCPAGRRWFRQEYCPPRHVSLCLAIRQVPEVAIQPEDSVPGRTTADGQGDIPAVH